MRVVLVLLCVASSTLAAAEPTDRPPPERPTICIRGKRSCKSIVLAEVVTGGRYAFVTPLSKRGQFDFEFGAGLLVNRGPYAVGGSIGIRTITPTHLAAVVRGRYRHWLLNNVGLDASIGPMLGNANGVSTQFGIEASDHIAVVVDFDIAKVGDNIDASTAGGGFVQAGIGLRFGGYVAVPAFLAAVLSGRAIAGPST